MNAPKDDYESLPQIRQEANQIILLDHGLFSLSPAQKTRVIESMEGRFGPTRKAIAIGEHSVLSANGDSYTIRKSINDLKENIQYWEHYLDIR